MPSTNALSLITRALRVIGECAGEEVPTAAQAQDGLEHLQDLMDGLKTQRLSIPSLLRSVTPLVANKDYYTIGRGQEIDVNCPQTIEWARLIQLTSVPIPIEVPLRILLDQEWASVPQKTLTSNYPQSIYYHHGWDTAPTSTPPAPLMSHGRIYVYPVPAQGLSSLVLYIPVAFPEFVTLQTSYQFPPGWNRALRLKLAKALAAEYGRGFPSDEELAEAWADVKRVNTRNRELRSDYPDTYRTRLRYDILSDL